MISLAPSDWVRCPRPLPHATARLFCFPYAGGEASLFRTWPGLLPDDVREKVEICPIQLPGRGHRHREQPLFSSVSALIDVLVPEHLETSPLFPYLDKPFAIFGVSLGGLLAYELAQALSQRHQRDAYALLIACCRAPELPGPYALQGAESLGDLDFIEQIKSYGGTPNVILEDEQLMQRLLPKLRADALLQATYCYRPDLSLDAPICVIGGTEDTFVSLLELIAWQTHTRSAFRAHLCSGDHFFLRDAPLPVRAQLLEYCARTLRTVLPLSKSAVIQSDAPENTLSQV